MADNSITFDLKDEKRRLKNKDGRLFPDVSLYCEGHPKPAFRGILHLFFTILLPCGLKILLNAAGNKNYVAYMASTVYICSNMWCYGMSALYHVGKWSVQTEIIFQKLDHCGVAILSTGTMIPCCLLLLPSYIGIPFLCISVVCCCRACYHIFKLEPSVCRQVIVPCVMLPFLPWMYIRMNCWEFGFVVGTIISQIVGLAVFVNQWPDPMPSVFGYHEIFHLFVVMAGNDTKEHFAFFLLSRTIVVQTAIPLNSVFDTKF